MVVAAGLGYLIGSFPTAVIAGRTQRLDPRQWRDGNAGWWNSRAVLGEGLAALVLLGDLLKGVLAALIGIWLWGPWWTAYVAVAFAMLGHAFPVFAHFRRGRSILTFVGGLAGLSPTSALIALVVGFVSAVVTRKFEYGARIAMLVFPFIQLFFD